MFITVEEPLLLRGSYGFGLGGFCPTSEHFKGKQVPVEVTRITLELEALSKVRLQRCVLELILFGIGTSEEF